MNKYGLSFITPNNILVTTNNGVGSAIELIYVLIFVLYALNSKKKKIIALLVLILVAMIISVRVFHGVYRNFFCGMVANIFTIVMCTSPLSTVFGMNYGKYFPRK